jgi:hypothetical protein
MAQVSSEAPRASAEYGSILRNPQSLGELHHGYVSVSRGVFFNPLAQDC